MMNLTPKLQNWKTIKSIWAKESEGIGDTVAKMTKTFGIQPCEECERRRKAFNRAVSYKKFKMRFEKLFLFFKKKGS
jgi:hypothetical protein